KRGSACCRSRFSVAGSGVDERVALARFAPHLLSLGEGFLPHAKAGERMCEKALPLRRRAPSSDQLVEQPNVEFICAALFWRKCRPFVAPGIVKPLRAPQSLVRPEILTLHLYSHCQLRCVISEGRSAVLLLTF
ncbi:MAG: hypothetical protein ACXW3X_12215, partial [Rhodoplanes sp.]